MQVAETSPPRRAQRADGRRTAAEIAASGPAYHVAPRPPLSEVEREVIDIFIQIASLLGHPCKIYNLLAIAAPILYIGPRPSHITEILERLPQDYPWWHANHGDIEAVCRAIRLARDYATTRRRDDVTPETAKRASVPVVLKTEFSQAALLPRLLTAVTGDARPKTQDSRR